jgi:hypothetical protein
MKKLFIELSWTMSIWTVARMISLVFISRHVGTEHRSSHNYWDTTVRLSFQITRYSSNIRDRFKIFTCFFNFEYLKYCLKKRSLYTCMYDKTYIVNTHWTYIHVYRERFFKQYLRYSKLKKQVKILNLSRILDVYLVIWKDRRTVGFLLAIVLSVLWFTDSDYPFCILWPLFCLSFDLRILITPLVSSKSSWQKKIEPTVKYFWVRIKSSKISYCEDFKPVSYIRRISCYLKG